MGWFSRGPGRKRSKPSEGKVPSKRRRQLAGFRKLTRATKSGSKDVARPLKAVEASAGRIANRLDSNARLLQNVPRIDTNMIIQNKLLRMIADDLLAAVSPRYSEPKRLFGPHAQVYSQNYEDAMIGEIFTRIGFGSRRFVEIGVEDGHQNCTRMLLEHCGFSGVWVEMDPEACARIRTRFAAYIESGRLVLVEGMATAETINDLIPPEFRDVDLVSVDVDQNTSHVWRAMDLKARVACIEYNAAFPPMLDIETPYEAETVWDGGHIYGGSLKAIERIGAGKQMSLVGCDLHGVNAFLIADSEDLSKFSAPFTAENHFEPLRLQLVSERGHRRVKAS